MDHLAAVLVLAKDKISLFHLSLSAGGMPLSDFSPSMDHYSIVIFLCLTGCISQGALGSYSIGIIKNRKSAQRANTGFSAPLTVGSCLLSLWALMKL